MVFRWAQSLGWKVNFLIKNLKMDIGNYFGVLWILLWNNVYKFYLVEFIPFGCVPNEFPSCDCWVKKVRIFVEKKVTEIRVTEIRVSKIRVTEIRISSNHDNLHGAIFCSRLELSRTIELYNNWGYPQSDSQFYVRCSWGAISLL